AQVAPDERVVDQHAQRVGAVALADGVECQADADRRVPGQRVLAHQVAPADEPAADRDREVDPAAAGQPLVEGLAAERPGRRGAALLPVVEVGLDLVQDRQIVGTDGSQGHELTGQHGPSLRSGPAAGSRIPYPRRVMRTYSIRTYGCQMNVHDSERLAGLL